SGKIDSLEIVRENPVSVEPSKGLFASGKKIDCRVVFPVLHGQFGEDGAVQGLLETAEIPYVGGGILASAVSFDKEMTKKIWVENNLPVVPWFCVRKVDFLKDGFFPRFSRECEDKFGYPVFVKPCSAGSSVGANKVNNTDELLKMMEKAFEYDEKILIEQFIPAREIECAVLGNDEVTVFRPGEIIPSHEFYDYDAKYTDPNGAALQIPANLEEKTEKVICEIAAKAYKALELTGLSRVDFFVSKADSGLYLNEVNTLPGFTSISMYPKMCIAGGISYPDLIDTLLDLAIQRFNARGILKTTK
ncbi:MAG: D-alanine--D-alanine ligase, partial [Spirochaetaceae bacterium]|nr:D-alanine--D-alanine ligase [Spirochaetaceae bacterium]